MAPDVPFIAGRLESTWCPHYRMATRVGGGMSESTQRRRGPRRRTWVRQGGVSLVELMVTLAVLGILAAVAVPAMSSLIDANRLAGTSSELTASLQLARSEAIRSRSSVTVCATADGASCGGNDWSRWVVRGVDNTTGNAVVMQSSGVTSDSVQVSGPGAGLVFRSSGLLEGQGQLTVCVPGDSLSDNQRLITVMVSGTVISEKKSGGGACP